MDFEDIITLVFVVILAILPKKKKQVFEEEPEFSDDPNVTDSYNPNMAEVRERIEALKRQRRAELQDSQAHKTQSSSASSNRRNFSAYKHLPKPDLPKSINIEENLPNELTHLSKPKISTTSYSINNHQKNMAHKKSNVHEWILGKIILDTPAFRKNYGNFFNR